MKNPILFAVLALASSTFASAADFVPVCERTPAVARNIASQVRKPCEAITAADLAAIKRIAVPNQNIPGFKAGDFSGLPALEVLNIKGNPTPTLPLGLLTDLPNLKTLVLFGNDLAALPEDFLQGNELIQDLHIFDNPFTTIPEAVWQRLGAAKHLVNLDFNLQLDQASQQRLQALFPAGGRTVLNFF